MKSDDVDYNGDFFSEDHYRYDDIPKTKEEIDTGCLFSFILGMVVLIMIIVLIIVS